MDCARCLKAHGPGCPAAVTVDGEPVCVFCLDGVACPTAMRILKQLRSPHHSPARFAVIHAKEVTAAAAARKKSQSQEVDLQNQNQKEDQMTVTSPAPTSATSTAAPQVAAPRICRVQGCKKQLGPTNSSGWCSEHRPHTKVNGNGAAGIACTCRVPGCGSALGPSNLSGTCRAHRIQAARAAVQAERPAAPAVKGNGHDPAHGNGNGVEDRLRSLGVSRIEQRVKILLDAVPLDAVIGVIPIEDKQKFVTAWLAGTL